MKKFLTMLALAGVMAACNSGDDETDDDDTMNVDTTTVMPMPDTTMTTDTMGTTGDTTTRR